MRLEKREEVYRVIDAERDYQNSLGPDRTDTEDGSHEVGEYITMLHHYLNEATSSWTKNAGSQAALHNMRKIAAIAVRCMEEHGALERD
jgi:GTP cyclohydrolase III